MTFLERVTQALKHKETGRVPFYSRVVQENWIQLMDGFSFQETSMPGSFSASWNPSRAEQLKN